MTNREWLESMSDEKFTREIRKRIISLNDYYQGEIWSIQATFINWLQSEHKENDKKEN